jgi:hypothetical protein
MSVAMEQRANNKFRFKMNKIATEIFQLVKKANGDNVFTRVLQWHLNGLNIKRRA